MSDPHAAPTGDLRPNRMRELAADLRTRSWLRSSAVRAADVLDAIAARDEALASAQPLPGEKVRLTSDIATHRAGSTGTLTGLSREGKWDVAFDDGSVGWASLDRVKFLASAQPAAVATEITMGLGLVDVADIHHEGRHGILFRPRPSGETIPVGDEGELQPASYWPAPDDVVIWIENPEGAAVVYEYLAPFLAQPAAVAGDDMREKAIKAAMLRLEDHDLVTVMDAKLVDVLTVTPGASIEQGEEEIERLATEAVDAALDVLAGLALVAPQVDAALERAARNLVPYLKWTIGPESPGYHPTMPSAVAALLDALKSATPARTYTEADTDDRMRKISDLIAELQGIRDRFGDTCVYIRRGGLSWGAVALNRQHDDQTHGVFDLQAQHDRDMKDRLEQVEHLLASMREWRQRAWDAEAKLAATEADMAAARAEERERCIIVVRDIAATMSAGWKMKPLPEGCGGAEAALNVGVRAIERIRALPPAADDVASGREGGRDDSGGSNA